MAILNEPKRPFFLLEGLDDPDLKEVERFIKSIGGSCQIVPESTSVVAEQFDMIVTGASDATKRSREVPTLAFGSSYATLAVSQPTGSSTFVRLVPKTVETARSVEDSWDGGVRRLAQGTLATVSPKHTESVWQLDTRGGGVHRRGGKGQKALTPFISDSEGRVAIRAAALRTYSLPTNGSVSFGADIWVLPWETEKKEEWLEAFIRFLAEKRENLAFANTTDWRRTSRHWMSLAQLDATEKLDSLHEKRRAFLQQIDEQLAETKQRVAATSDEDERGNRRLLTADGDDLERAVKEALETLGFDVKLMDGHHEQHTGAKLEDLRVRDGEWEAIVEVKGYSKGAKVTDVPSIGSRPMLAYIREKNVDSVRGWHVVNAFRKNNPDSRPPAISDRAALEQARRSDTCVIDTRDLLRAVRAVERQEVDAVVVRERMKEALPTWRYPDTE